MDLTEDSSGERGQTIGERGQTIGFLLVPRFTIYEFFLAVECLRLANLLHADRRPGPRIFEWKVLSPDGKPVEASNGMTETNRTGRFTRTGQRHQAASRAVQLAALQSPRRGNDAGHRGVANDELEGLAHGDRSGRHHFAIDRRLSLARVNPVPSQQRHRVGCIGCGQRSKFDFQRRRWAQLFHPASQVGFGKQAAEFSTHAQCVEALLRLDR